MPLLLKEAGQELTERGNKAAGLRTYANSPATGTAGRISRAETGSSFITLIFPWKLPAAKAIF
ncbi:MAG: hypothetical protein ACOX1J_05110 [Dethiobacteria bacterium]|jgi:hypothetical protein